MKELNGYVTPAFEAVRRAVQEQLLLESEVGLSLVVGLDGRRVVDLWGGQRDAARTMPWQRDTIANVWSITKTVSSLAVLRLVDAGALDLYAPVAAYWPEFAVRGKDRIEVRHLMSHTAGLSGLDRPAVLEELYDARGIADRLAAQTPWWEPGTASGYHVLSYGHLLGEIVRRVSGLPLREFVAQELAGPLGADFQLGLRPADLDRVADVIPPADAFDPSVLDHQSVAYKTFTGPAFTGDAANTPAWRAADLGAANEHGDAASVAKMLTPLTAGGGPLKPATVDLIFDEQSNGVDLVNGLHLRWGIGYALPDERTLPWIPAGRVAFWGGWGGSMAIADLDRRLTIGYVMNRMGADILGSDRAAAYVRAIYASLGV